MIVTAPGPILGVWGFEDWGLPESRACLLENPVVSELFMTFKIYSQVTFLRYFFFQEKILIIRRKLFRQIMQICFANLKTILEGKLCLSENLPQNKNTLRVN